MKVGKHTLITYIANRIDRMSQKNLPTFVRQQTCSETRRRIDTNTATESESGENENCQT